MYFFPYTKNPRLITEQIQHMKSDLSASNAMSLFDRRIVCLHPLLARIAPFPIIRFPDKASNQNQNRDARAGGQRDRAHISP